jgi:hypothetical protein
MKWRSSKQKSWSDESVSRELRPSFCVGLKLVVDHAGKSFDVIKISFKSKFTLPLYSKTIYTELDQ